MDLMIGHLVDETGVAARTIREWIRLGMLPRPQGAGPAAVYTRDHLLRVWVISSLRTQGMLLEDIKPLLATMSPREMARYRPKAASAEKLAPEATPAAAPGEPGAPPPPRFEASANDDSRLAAQGTALPGRRYAVMPLLPGLILMVDEEAASIVRRAALEILERYGMGSA